MSVPVQEMAETISIRRLGDVTYEMIIYAPRIASICRAGQFVHVRVCQDFQPLLRRPLSIGPPPIFTSAQRAGYLRLLYTVRGVGTRLLMQKVRGDRIDLIGPLGRPFRDPPAGSLPILAAGGIGVVPLLMMDDQLKGERGRLFLLGARSQSHLPVDQREIERRAISICTDDGSMGYNGTVVQLLERRLEELADRAVELYVCGPARMMMAIKEMCLRRELPAQVSLEVPMGCAVGACQSCAVPSADGRGYLLVCKNGPAFDIREVDLTPGMVP